MRVLLRMSRVSGGFAQKPGDVIDVPDDEGARMIADGICVPADQDIAAVSNGGAVETREETGGRGRRRSS